MDALEQRPAAAMIELGWLSGYRVGAAEIDTDHRRLLAALLRIRGLLAARHYRACGAMIGGFAAAVTAHFAREERVLRRAADPDLDRHIGEHAILAERLAGIRRAAEEDPDPLALADHVDALAAVLMVDLVALDGALHRLFRPPPQDCRSRAAR